MRSLAGKETSVGHLTKLIPNTHISYWKLSLVNISTEQHNAPVSSNFCKELDLARFHQRAFFCPNFCPGPVPAGLLPAK
jgi:hypothetical protein